MKKQRNLLITLVIFLALMVGAYALYTNLSKNYKPQSSLASLGSGNTADTVTVDDTAPESLNTDEQNNGTAASDSENTTESESETYPAPDFTVYDYDGNKVSLSEHFGKPIILNFWASWCGPCQSEMPEFESAFAEYGDKIEFMMVNLTDGSRETVSGAHEFIESKGYTFPIYYDSDRQGAMTYGVSSIPATYFIDADGNLTAYGIGALDGETLAKGIGMIYSEK